MSIFPMYHGTSTKAIGSEQLNKKAIEARGHPFLGQFWATRDLNQALEYAKKKGKQTGSDPIVLVVKTNQELQYVDAYGKHSYPAYNTHKAPIHIKRVIPLTNTVEIAARKALYKLPSFGISALLLAGAGMFAYNKVKHLLPTSRD